MPKFWGRREREDTDPANSLQAVAEPAASSTGTEEPEHGARPGPKHDRGSVYDQDVDGASVPVNRDGTPPYRDEAGYGRAGTNPYDQDAPHYQGAPYHQSELRSEAPAAQHEDPLVQREPPPAREEGMPRTASSGKRRMPRTASSGKRRMPRTASSGKRSMPRTASSGKRRMPRTASSGKRRMPRTASNSWIVR